MSRNHYEHDETLLDDVVKACMEHHGNEKVLRNVLGVRINRALSNAHFNGELEFRDKLCTFLEEDR